MSALLPLPMKTLTAKIRDALRDSPGTSSELGSILLPRRPHREAMRLCSAIMCNLRTDGELKVVGEVQITARHGGKVASNLFALK